MKYKTTKKLFYNQYLYKLSAYNELAHIFRVDFNRNNWNYCKKTLHDYLNRYHAGEELIRKVYNNVHVPIDTLDLLDANAIFEFIKDKRDQYLLRVDRHRLSFYTNNEEFLESFSDLIENVEVSKPDPAYIDFLKSNRNTIVVTEPSDYEYKVTFGWNTPTDHLGQFLDNHSAKTKVGPKTRYNIDKRLGVYNNYIYVKDEKILLLLQMIVGTSITRIDRLVYSGDIDKYE